MSPHPTPRPPNQSISCLLEREVFFQRTFIIPTLGHGTPWKPDVTVISNVLWAPKAWIAIPFVLYSRFPTVGGNVSFAKVFTKKYTFCYHLRCVSFYKLQYCVYTLYMYPLYFLFLIICYLPLFPLLYTVLCIQYSLYSVQYVHQCKNVTVCTDKWMFNYCKFGIVFIILFKSYGQKTVRFL